MRYTLRQCAMAFVVLYLIGSAINLPVSMQFLQSRIGSPKRPTINLRGAAAQSHEYPTRTPHTRPWPPPDYWSESEAFGYKRIDATALLPSSRDQLTMQFELTGWPLPVFEQVHCWWPEQDPKWATAVEPDPVMRLHWTGVLLNPAIFAIPVWLALFATPALIGWVVRARRRRAGQCTRCGYPVGESDLCTECGSPVDRQGDRAK